MVDSDGGKTIVCGDASVTVQSGSGCTVSNLATGCVQVVCGDAGKPEVVCAPKATGLNMAAVHDPTSPEYDPGCLSCHLDKLNETSLKAGTPGFHALNAMFAALPGNTPSKKCVYCHPSVDMSPNRSAGNIRRNVDVTICKGCHSSGTFDFYQP